MIGIVAAALIASQVLTCVLLPYTAYSAAHVVRYVYIPWLAQHGDLAPMTHAQTQLPHDHHQGK